ncbi:Rubrerythrin [Proteiniborus ethanoligenes]|uniref:Rubrerythrin n=1 Tax=Proteiniborus ethanoligenes TaxID=415015 RepID=A0A1H3NJU5_9FIRM|nr:ferritin family protein [Proteiniborus ethanoligenes]SDY89023.1 Rubrerythrin [Proteiniborus ethanoligenes]
MKKYEQIMRYAMQMELDGYNFFKEKAEKFSNPTTRKLFLDLAEVEMDHFYFIKDQLDEYLETDSFKIDHEHFKRDESSIFESREKSEHIAETLKESDIPDITILRMAYLIERDYAEFYRKAAEKADDEIAKAMFEKLAEWEDGHERLFKSEYERRMEEYMNLPWGG